MYWGSMGMPRRIYTYGADMGFGTTNLIVTIGALMFAAGIGLFFFPFSGAALGPARRSRPVGRAKPRMVDALTTAGLQFRGHSFDRVPASLVGGPAAGTGRAA